MLQDPFLSSLESPTERAQRIWRNSHIIKSIKKQAPIKERPQIVQPDNQPLIKQITKFKNEIRKIICKQPSETLCKYIISIKARKNRLLLEKLKRLERDENEN